MLSRIKKSDTVVVLSGKDKGKQGQVLLIDKKKNLVLVKSVGIVVKHKKAKKSGEKSSIIREERFLPLCKLMPVCPACKKACRIQVSVSEDKKSKHRVCARCKEAF
jgi:large subunit ribosomal protein L24